jgi:hypothetical protein
MAELQVPLVLALAVECIQVSSLGFMLRRLQNTRKLLTEIEEVQEQKRTMW